MARTKAGLKTLTRRYLNFCKKFRMMLDHGKSKVMHFRRSRYRTDVNVGFTVDGLSFEEPKAKKSPDGGCRHTYLGFLLDEALSGSAHFDRAIARGAGFTHKAGKVSSSMAMGEDMGLWYLQSVVGQSCLYNIELVGRGHDLKHLKNVWEGLLSKATLVGHYEGQNTFSSRLELARPGMAPMARSVYYLVLSSYMRNMTVDRYEQTCSLYNLARQDSLVIYQRWRWPLQWQIKRSLSWNTWP